MTQNELVRELFYYLDKTEETDEGRVFHPVVVSSCRADYTIALGLCLQDLKESITE